MRHSSVVSLAKVLCSCWLSSRELTKLRHSTNTKKNTANSSKKMPPSFIGLRVKEITCAVKVSVAIVPVVLAPAMKLARPRPKLGPDKTKLVVFVSVEAP